MYLGYGLLFLLQIKEVRKDLKIKKILNNNAVLVGENGNDFIWIGVGLGFQMKPGLEADETKIQKIFVLKGQITSLIRTSPESFNGSLLMMYF